MKNKSLFLILFAILVILTVSVSSSFAQDVDISNMDHEQLLQLMQQIMEKLEQEEGIAEESNEAPVSIMTPMPETGNETRIFSIYENKKLILERLPDYYFTQPQTIEEDDDGPSDPGRKIVEISCNEYCGDRCWRDYDPIECSYSCLYDCQKEHPSGWITH